MAKVRIDSKGNIHPYKVSDLEFISALGFKKKWLDDKSGYWHELNIKGMLNNLHISIELDNKTITVWCDEPKKMNCRMNYTFALVHKKYTRKTLLDILKYFKK
jgi:hypothetical protein